MRIASAEVIPYALPFRKPYVTARGELQRREMVLLRLRDEDGVEGLGEAVPLALRGGVGLRDVVKELEGWGETREVGQLSPPGRCAVETALLDLRGRRIGKELGKEVRDEAVECNATLVSGPAAKVAAEAERWAQAGF